MPRKKSLNKFQEKYDVIIFQTFSIFQGKSSTDECYKKTYSHYAGRLSGSWDKLFN